MVLPAARGPRSRCSPCCTGWCRSACPHLTLLEAGFRGGRPWREIEQRHKPGGSQDRRRARAPGDELLRLIASGLILETLGSFISLRFLFPLAQPSTLLNAARSACAFGLLAWHSKQSSFTAA